MEYQTYQNRLSQLSARFNLMVCLVFGLLIANVLLAGLAWVTHYHQRIEITPFFGGDGYHKSESSLDAHYVGLMSENFIYSRLNVTPDTVSSNFQRLATYVNAANYSEVMKLLNHESEVVKSKKISSNFVITSLKINMKALTVDVSGVLQRHVGLREIPPENMIYRLSYTYQLGRLTINRFKQIKSFEKEKTNV
jgi:conjugal transfer pilus assembly protein TraE